MTLSNYLDAIRALVDEQTREISVLKAKLEGMAAELADAKKEIERLTRVEEPPPPPPPGRPPLLWHDRFDPAPENKHGRYLVEAPNGAITAYDSTLQVTCRAKQPVDQGGKRRRSEICQWHEDEQSQVCLRDPMGSTRWYAISVFFPENEYDKKDPNKWIFQQWHGDRNVSDGGGTQPCLSFNVWKRSSGLDLFLRLVAGDQTKGKVSQRDIYSAPFDSFVGEWTRFVVKATWEWTRTEDGGTGSIELWINGRRVVEFQGPTCYRDPKGPYARLGIYWPSAGEGEDNPYDADWYHQVMYRDYRIGDERHQLADML